jgi:hypothetical protein
MHRPAPKLPGMSVTSTTGDSPRSTAEWGQDSPSHPGSLDHYAEVFCLLSG